MAFRAPRDGREWKATPPSTADDGMIRITMSTPDEPFSLISYNLWHARAQQELPDLVEEYRPDFLCLQEAAGLSLPATLGGLRLASATSTNRFRVALYVHEERFEIEHAASFTVFRSLHDRLLGYSGERLAAARLHDRATGHGVVVGSIHATPLTDPNTFRLRQISEAHRHLRGLGRHLPVVMAGDFNYPVFPRSLRAHVARQGFRVARSSTGTYQHHKRPYMRGSFDLATTFGLTVDEVVSLPQRASDHKPIRLTLRY